MTLVDIKENKVIEEKGARRKIKTKKIGLKRKVSKHGETSYASNKTKKRKRSRSRKIRSQPYKKTPRARSQKNKSVQQNRREVSEPARVMISCDQINWNKNSSPETEGMNALALNPVSVSTSQSCSKLFVTYITGLTQALNFLKNLKSDESPTKRAPIPQTSSPREAAPSQAQARPPVGESPQLPTPSPNQESTPPRASSTTQEAAPPRTSSTTKYHPLSRASSPKRESSQPRASSTMIETPPAKASRKQSPVLRKYSKTTKEDRTSEIRNSRKSRSPSKGRSQFRKIKTSPVHRYMVNNFRNSPERLQVEKQKSIELWISGIKQRSATKSRDSPSPLTPRSILKRSKRTSPVMSIEDKNDSSTDDRLSDNRDHYHSGVHSYKKRHRRRHHHRTVRFNDNVSGHHFYVDQLTLPMEEEFSVPLHDESEEKDKDTSTESDQDKTSPNNETTHQRQSSPESMSYCIIL